MITIQAILSGESSGQTDRASVAEQIKQFRLVAGLLSSKVRKHVNILYLDSSNCRRRNWRKYSTNRQIIPLSINKIFPSNK